MLMYAFAAQRNGDNALVAPSASKASIQSMYFNTHQFRPFGKRASDAFSGKRYNISTIAYLLLTSAPLKIARLVMAVCINTIKRMFKRRLAANTIKKFLKTLKVEFDTSTAISLIFAIRTTSACSGY